MPRLSRWCIRAALLYLLAGFTLGGLMLAGKSVPVHPAIRPWLPSHAELLLLGWIAQLTMGVAFWILPRFRSGPVRGNVVAAWIAFLMLNAGVLATAAASGLALAWLLPVGRTMETIAALTFAFHAWPRVKPTFEPPQTGGRPDIGRPFRSISGEPAGH